tara:strand:- start:26 stop:205 length:180 start_codon:yes stop_codon:yes gene_type:complete
MIINTVKQNLSISTNELISYRVTLLNSDKVLSVPLDSANIDYVSIQKWVADGNTIEDAD